MPAQDEIIQHDALVRSAAAAVDAARAAGNAAALAIAIAALEQAVADQKTFAQYLNRPDDCGPRRFWRTP